MATDWTLAPDQQIVRVDLHAAYGGGGQGGIAPSARSPNVLIFSDPASGEQHGYFDGWHDDGLFHYTGEGQRGDQRMRAGNATILSHRQDGRALRVFDGARGTVTYVGEFEIADDEPYYLTDARRATARSDRSSSSGCAHSTPRRRQHRRSTTCCTRWSRPFRWSSR